MRFVISGGGTAGHIYPAIAVGKELERRGHEVYFAGTPNGIESKLAPEAGFPFEAFDVSGFNRNHPTTLLKSSAKALRASSKAKSWLKKIGADGVVGFGGYVSIPVGRAASELHIPLVIHEQNSACGMANKYLAPHAAYIALTYESARVGLKASCPIHITGNPVRPEMLDVDPAESRKMLGIPEDALFLFVFGGSLGAKHVNEAIVALSDKLMSIDNLYILHVTGPKQYEATKAALDEHGIEVSGPDFEVGDGWSNPGKRYILTGYFNHMSNALAACDVVVSRAGATSLAEITAIGAVALLVPYPFATDDHQTKNSMELVESGASLMCHDDQVEDKVFEDKLFELLENPVKRLKMHELTRLLGRTNAAQLVADLAEESVGIYPVGTAM